MSTSSSSSSGGLLEVGRVVRAHGVRGEIVVDLLTDRAERVAPGSVLVVEGASTVTVEASRPHQGKWIVALVGVVDRSGVERVRGRRLLAEPIEDPDELWVHDLVGANVVDARGEVIGSIDAVQANPASDLLVLDRGALVPVRFIVERLGDGTVVVDLPDGLLDLF